MNAEPYRPNAGQVVSVCHFLKSSTTPASSARAQAGMFTADTVRACLVRLLNADIDGEAVHATMREKFTPSIELPGYFYIN